MHRCVSSGFGGRSRLRKRTASDRGEAVDCAPVWRVFARRDRMIALLSRVASTGEAVRGNAGETAYCAPVWRVFAHRDRMTALLSRLASTGEAIRGNALLRIAERQSAASQLGECTGAVKEWLHRCLWWLRRSRSRKCTASDRGETVYCAPLWRVFARRDRTSLIASIGFDGRSCSRPRSRKDKSTAPELGGFTFVCSHRLTFLRPHFLT